MGKDRTWLGAGAGSAAEVSSEELGLIRLVLYEPFKEMGAPMASMLRNEGLRKTIHVTSVATVVDLLMADQVDVLVLEMDGQREDLMTLSKRIRNLQIKTDPFVFIISTESALTMGAVLAYRLSGIDCVLNKPYSPHCVLEHMRNLARRPRRFVVRDGYAGPAWDGHGDTTKLVEVPNRLQTLLTQQEFDENAYHAAIAEWKRLVKGPAAGGAPAAGANAPQLNA